MCCPWGMSASLEPLQMFTEVILNLSAWLGGGVRSDLLHAGTSGRRWATISWVNHNYPQAVIFTLIFPRQRDRQAPAKAINAVTGTRLWALVSLPGTVLFF